MISPFRVDIQHHFFSSFSFLLCVCADQEEGPLIRNVNNNRLASSPLFRPNPIRLRFGQTHRFRGTTLAPVAKGNRADGWPMDPYIARRNTHVKRKSQLLIDWRAQSLDSSTLIFKSDSPHSAYHSNIHRHISSNVCLRLHAHAVTTSHCGTQV